MTPNEINLEIAELCKWKRVGLPEYYKDLNLCAEFEKTLTEKQQVWYLQKLAQIRLKEGVGGMIGCMFDKLVFATAPQRCEAFLRIHNKWEE